MRTVAEFTDIHTGATANMLVPFKGLDGIIAVAVVGHFLRGVNFCFKFSFAEVCFGF